MKYFLDTEFIEAPGHLDLISIGIVAEDGRTFYAESADVDWTRASQWVLDNVKPHLDAPALLSRSGIASAVSAFIGDDPAPEFWGYYCAYDWVALCWLYGTMMDLPKGWPYLCRDLRQALDEHIKQPDDMPHHALSDAQWIASAWREHIGAS